MPQAIFILHALDVVDLIRAAAALAIWYSFAFSIFMALSRFWNWLRSVWQELTTMPVGLWVRRTAEEVLLMCWPPAPEER